MTVEVAEALRRAGVEHRIIDEAWCVARAREASNAEDRETYRGGIRKLAEAEGADREVLDRVAALVELAGGDVVLLFGGDGNYLGISTFHVARPGFHPAGGSAKAGAEGR